MVREASISWMTSRRLSARRHGTGAEFHVLGEAFLAALHELPFDQADCGGIPVLKEGYKCALLGCRHHFIAIFST